MNGGDLCEAGGSELATTLPQTAQPLCRFSKTFHVAKMLFILAASQLKAKSLTLFRKTANFLSIATLQHERGGFTCYLQKSFKGFFTRTMSCAKWRSSQCYNFPFLRSQELQNHIQTDRQTDKQTDRQTNCGNYLIN